MTVLQNGFTVNNHFISFYSNYLSGIFIHKVFVPGMQYTCGKFFSQYFFQVCLVNLNLFSQIKNFQNVLIAFKTDSA